MQPEADAADALLGSRRGSRPNSKVDLEHAARKTRRFAPTIAAVRICIDGILRLRFEVPNSLCLSQFRHIVCP
jgi:hypothetical protein